MPDREKVIKGLECCSDVGGKHCGKCPYASMSEPCREQLASDALTLLKEQDTKGKNRLPYSPDSNVQWT